MNGCCTGRPPPVNEVMPHLPAPARRHRVPSLGLPAVVGLAGAFAALLLSAAAGRAQQQGYGQTMGSSTLERQVFDAGPGSKSSSILDSTNPLDLLNKLRRNTALDEATSPDSAIDQALKDYEAKAPASPAPPAPTTRLKTP